VYRRADLSRTIVLVVALLLAAVSTGALARGSCAAAPHDESRPVLQGQGSGHASRIFHISPFGAEQTGIGATRLGRTNVALIGTSTPLLVWRHRRTERI
jgi:hypothetical protein